MERQRVAVWPKVTSSALVVSGGQDKSDAQAHWTFRILEPVQNSNESHQERRFVTKNPALIFLDPSPGPGCLSGFAGRALCSLYFRREVDTSPLKLPHKS